MIFRSPTENENLLRFLTQFSEHLSFPHAFSGESRRNSDWAPWLKHSGVTGLRVVSLQRDGIFEGGHEERRR
jgi:hypothetical protein